jgi:hypothetical protein
MKIKKRLAPIAMAPVGALGIGALTAGAALAGPGPGTVKAVTHASNLPDTCACTTDTLSSNGCVWAYDNLSRQFTVTSNGNNDYTVVVTDHGSFAAFAEPNNADLNTFYPISANGSINGTYTVDVVSASAPNPAAVPAQVSGDQSTSATIRMLFNNPSAVVTGGDYTYTYKAGGNTYTQTTNSITGDITGH